MRPVADHSRMSFVRRLGRVARLRPSGRALLVTVALVGLGAAAAARVAAPSVSTVRSLSPVSACGVERWTVKTLQDRPRLFPVRAPPAASLFRPPGPGALPLPRLAFERHVFRVTAAATLVRSEDD